MSLPTDYDARKAFPILTVLTAYFPDAIEALVELCKQGNVQHKVNANAVNPFKLEDDAITWDRSKSMDQLNTLMRHLWDHTRAKRSNADLRDADGILHIVKVLWRAAAEAQLTIEASRKSDHIAQMEKVWAASDKIRPDCIVTTPSDAELRALWTPPVGSRHEVAEGANWLPSDNCPCDACRTWQGHVDNAKPAAQTDDFGFLRSGN